MVVKTNEAKYLKKRWEKLTDKTKRLLIGDRADFEFIRMLWLKQYYQEGKTIRNAREMYKGHIEEDEPNYDICD